MNLVMPKYNSQVLKPKIVDSKKERNSSVQTTLINSSHPKHPSRIKSMLKELRPHHKADMFARQHRILCDIMDPNRKSRACRRNYLAEGRSHVDTESFAI
ncbi:hypothetical protein BDN72DRAFT_336355 [Pluteus cervinus]|uniref:Uncharacterized protein n=1 Tax=Pluteus cervinus TaxID=181527 RepID=A0ACD3B3E6_9AGAR|nr:hypothetical protein BDN72DRAFT_336355 [Pluteus cervinus]